jgi:hypothetical protein
MVGRFVNGIEQRVDGVLVVKASGVSLSLTPDFRTDSCAALKAARAFSCSERDDGMDGAIRQSGAPLQKSKLDEHRHTDDRAAETFDQTARRRRRSAGR